MRQHFSNRFAFPIPGDFVCAKPETITPVQTESSLVSLSLIAQSVMFYKMKITGAMTAASRCVCVDGGERTPATSAREATAAATLLQNATPNPRQAAMLTAAASPWERSIPLCCCCCCNSARLFIKLLSGLYYICWKSVHLETRLLRRTRGGSGGGGGSVYVAKVLAILCWKFISSV